MQTTLNCLPPGGEATVLKLQMEPAQQRRLLQLGLIPGTRVRCRYRSPGGQVTALEFRDTVVAMRTRQLRKIRVELW